LHWGASSFGIMFSDTAAVLWFQGAVCRDSAFFHALRDLTTSNVE
jgi:hypothetical protein